MAENYATLKTQHPEASDQEKDRTYAVRAALQLLDAQARGGADIVALLDADHNTISRIADKIQEALRPPH